ncbi:hypothetical protein C8R48DRAFT_745598 [Suillus tomentosus]|nr:hypothetical protein C8R48DRAFT_745598 [Suillus tomentosus]
MALSSRWDVNHPECIKRITHHLFHKAVDDIEHLVVMRLLELTKLQMSGLGYKLHTQISNALKTLANVIQNALNYSYKYAAQLNPPRPALQWEQIVEYSFLAKFDLLRENDGKMQSKRWEYPSYRHASTQFIEQHHANKEICRLNSNNSPLAVEMQRCWADLRSVNTHHLWRIERIMELPGLNNECERDINCLHRCLVVPEYNRTLSKESRNFCHGQQSTEEESAEDKLNTCI